MCVWVGGGGMTSHGVELYGRGGEGWGEAGSPCLDDDKMPIENKGKLSLLTATLKTIASLITPPPPPSLSLYADHLKKPFN